MRLRILTQLCSTLETASGQAEEKEENDKKMEDEEAEEGCSKRTKAPPLLEEELALTACRVALS